MPIATTGVIAMMVRTHKRSSLVFLNSVIWTWTHEELRYVQAMSGRMSTVTGLTDICDGCWIDSDGSWNKKFCEGPDTAA